MGITSTRLRAGPATEERLFQPTGALGRLRLAAAQPIPGDSLRFFRVAFGLVVAVSALRLLLLGWSEALYSGPQFHFAYSGLGWVPVLPTPLFRVQVALIALAALAVIFAFRYRIALALLWFLFTWMEFSEATVYLNHYWFVTVMSALLIFLPLDSPGTVPRGALWLVRFQVAVVYCFAGVAKLNSDWLIHGLPLAIWLPGKSDVPLIGGLLEHHASALLLSWAGAFFDCTVIAFLLWRRTRLIAWLAVLAFHLVTFVLFPTIGVFPFLMVGASLVFFEPDWPRRLAARLGYPGGARVHGAGQATAPAIAPATAAAPAPLQPARPAVSRLALGAAVVWICVQVLLPLRQFVIPGDGRWTGEGFRFAWNVLAVERVGSLSFRVAERGSGESHRVAVDDLFTPQQLRAVPVEPELIRQAAHHVAASEAARLGVRRDAIEVRADAFVSVNGRRARRLIDPSVDLAAAPATLWHQDWILPGP